MLMMPTALEKAGKEGVRLLCADGQDRHCFPLLAVFMADYEEQVTLTGIKSGRKCSTCHIHTNERHDLTTAIQRPWPFRTHQSTKDQIRMQQEGCDTDKKDDSDYIRPFRNFAWGHNLSNIHKMMAPDFLHQVLKGLTSEHLMHWIKGLIQSEIQAGKYWGLDIPRTDGCGQEMSNVDALITTRFAQVERFTDMMVWDSWANVGQWTGKMYKSLLRQLVPAIAPLLKQNEGAMLFIRAFVDFTILSQYVSHDESTIRYLAAAMSRMDKTKDVFLPFRPSKAGLPHFNIPKLHAITHYPESIQRLGAIGGTDTEYSEQAHKLQKAFYRRTNKRNNYEEQMLRYNTMHLNTMLRNELELWASTNIIDTADPMSAIQTIRLGPAVDVCAHRSYLWNFDDYTTQTLQDRRINISIWRTVEEVQRRMEITDLASKLAPFVRECRKQIDGIRRTDWDVDRLEADDDWVSKMPLSIHHSVVCYIRFGKDATDTNKLDKVFARCTPLWADTGAPRYDAVMVREYERANDSLHGNKVGRLRLLLTIQDTGRLDSEGKYPKFAGALVETLQVCDGGKIDARTGMLRVQSIKPSSSRTRRTLDALQIYDINHIARPISLVPTDINVTDCFFVNNYSDWDIYNTIYDEDFERINRAQVNAYARKQARTRR